MALPKQVEEAGKAADEALKGPEPEEHPTEETEETQPITDEADTVESVKAELAKEQQRYKVLQGMYNSHVEPFKKDVNVLNDLKGKLKEVETEKTALQSKVAKLVTQNAEFVRQITDLQNTIDSKKTETPAPGESGGAQILSDEDRDILRAEGIEDQAIDIITKLISKSTAESKPKETTSEKSTPKSESENDVITAFWDGLDSSIPNWSAINKSSEFIDWLSQPAPYHKGKIKHDLLSGAQKEWDLETVLSMFRDFMAGDTYKPEKAPAEETPPKTDEVTHEQTLESQVEPDRSQTVDINLNPPVKADATILAADGETKIDIGYMMDPKQNVRASDISLFYKDATQTDGIRVKNPELYKKIDAAIVKAGAENRVIQT